MATSDHRFIDSLGAVVQGRDEIRRGWLAYFEMVQNFRLAISRRFSDEAEVVLLGVARGSYAAKGRPLKDSAWSTPVAVRATIHDNQVAEWEVYADNEPIRELPGRSSS